MLILIKTGADPATTTQIINFTQMDALSLITQGSGPNERHLLTFARQTGAAIQVQIESRSYEAIIKTLTSSKEFVSKATVTRPAAGIYQPAVYDLREYCIGV